MHKKAASGGSGALTWKKEVSSEHYPNSRLQRRGCGVHARGDREDTDMPLPYTPPSAAAGTPANPCLQSGVWSPGVTDRNCRIYLMLNCWVFLILKFHRSNDSAPHLWLKISARKLHHFVSATKDRGTETSSQDFYSQNSCFLQDPNCRWLRSSRGLGWHSLQLLFPKSSLICTFQLS